MRVVSRRHVEHKGRRKLAQTLLCTGPLTAGGLAKEVERSKAYVSRHLRILSRAGVIVPRGGDRIAGEEITYALRLNGLPDWAFEGLFGEFPLPVCLQVMAAIGKAGELTPAGVAERTELSENDAIRYLLFLEASGLVAIGASPRTGNPLRGYVNRAKGRWWTYLRRDKDDEGRRDDGA